MRPLWHYTCGHRAADLHKDGYLRPGLEVSPPGARYLAKLNPILNAIGHVGWVTDLDDLCVYNGHKVGIAPPELISCDRTMFRFRVLEPRGILPWMMVAPWWGPVAEILEQAVPGFEPVHVFIATRPVPVEFSPHHAGQTIPVNQHAG